MQCQLMGSLLMGSLLIGSLLIGSLLMAARTGAAAAGRAAGGAHLWLLVAALGWAGCSTTAPETAPKSQRVIGKPPPADQDPFAVKRMPGEAVPAEASGRVDEARPEDDRADEPAASKPGSTRSGQPQCFSCVRICPVDRDCEAAQKDVICGWGVHGKKIKARRLAKAECDATLDMARAMPMWSEIAGECPVATCR